MPDLVYVALIIALTGIAALFLVACDKVVGPDAAALVERARDDSAHTAPVSSVREEAAIV